jgi:PhnB protein
MDGAKASELLQSDLGRRNMSFNAVVHLNFRGEARAALEFYHKVFGGVLTVAAYKDLGSSQHQTEADQVIWGQVTAENGFTLMAFDVLPERLPFERGKNSFYVAVRSTTAEEARACWDRLREGAFIRQELGPAPWAPILYGMLEDRFGIIWIIEDSFRCAESAG